MKDKEKQIEEIERMTKIIYNTSNYSKVMATEIATYNVKHNYKRVEEDSAVLSREEYNELLLRPLNAMGDLISSKIKNKYKEKIEKLEETINEEYADISDYKDLVRKETAEKIYLQAKAIVDATKHIIQGREYLHIDALKEIIKSCGVEIKE